MSRIVTRNDGLQVESINRFGVPLVVGIGEVQLPHLDVLLLLEALPREFVRVYTHLLGIQHHNLPLRTDAALLGGFRFLELVID